MPLSQEEARARAEAEVQAYCGWHIAPSASVVLTLDGPCSPVLLLPSLNVTGVLGVTELGVVVDPAAYEWSRSGVIRRIGLTPWTGRFGALEVAFTHGHDEMPVDVAVVIDRVAARAVELADASQLLSQVGSVSYAVGVEGLRNTGLLSEADTWVLDRHRLPKRS